MTIIPVILSGGSGTRLWPLSSGNHPKQFLPLISEQTMIQETYLRLQGLDIGAPIVSCNEEHRFMVAMQLCQVMKDGRKPVILLEPYAKNTAPAIAAACCAALKQDKEAIVIVLPSDHVIANEEVFQNSIKKAVEVAQGGSLVTFGIVPTYPAMEYGYIRGGEYIAHNVYKLDCFVEKPDLVKAQEYLASGEFSWNSGMFVFRAQSFLDELTKFEPEMADLSKRAFDNAQIDEDFVRLDKQFFSMIRGNSIDYAVMERTDKGMIIKLNAGWNDVGSWTALWDINNKDANLNVIKGDVVVLDTTSSYIRAGKRTIAAIGLDNVVVVDSDDAVLIAAKGKIQDVKKVAEEILKRSGK